MAISGSELEDFSASSTVIAFDHPLPLLRGPIPASPSDDPSIGPFVLAFRDDQSWRIAYRATESKIIEQCQVGISDDSDASLFLSFLFFFFSESTRDARDLFIYLLGNPYDYAKTKLGLC